MKEPPKAAEGSCVICGSGAVIQTRDTRYLVHCLDCGTEVTLLIHRKHQSNNNKSK